MSMLDKKLLRDFRRLWVQMLAIALVLACGLATMVLSGGAYRSLEETRSAFYDRYRFASVFASANRAPKQLQSRIRAISGVSAVQLRIVKPVLLDVVGMKEPGTGMIYSLPDYAEPAVNRLYLRSGRFPAAGDTDEVAVIESFAKAHGFMPGDRFHVLMNGRKIELRIVGIVLSPEFVYSMGPGELIPDARRYGTFFMSEKVLAGIYDMEGAFNDAVLTTLRNADTDEIIERLDRLLDPYGGTGGYTRKDQISHAFLDAELIQLEAMAQVIPPIFLAISAFLVSMILSRLIVLEREQIGLLKAVGFGNFTVGAHYAKLVLAISAVGIVIGAAAGTWLGAGLTRIYGQFYQFPFLIFDKSVDLYIIAGTITAAAALLGAARSIYMVVALPPAVAMRAPAPARYFGLLSGLQRIRLFSQLTVMALRHMVRYWVRSLLTVIGVSLSVGLLVSALFAPDSIDHMIDTVFFRADRQDATVTFSGDHGHDAVRALSTLPGVIRVEPFRAVGAVLRSRHRERRISVMAVPPAAELSRILDADLEPMDALPRGLVLSERLAKLVQARVGDIVHLDLKETDRGEVPVVVSAIAQSYIGLTAYMNAEALDRLVGGPRKASGARLLVDGSRLDALYRAVKNTPAIASISLQRMARQHFRETIETNIIVQMTVYIVLSVIITFGVVYNSARIQLSERARELASLRVLGFTKSEVAGVLLVELGVIVAVAQPLGWFAGYGLAYAIVKGFESDLFRIPLTVEPATAALSSLVVIAAAAVSSLVVVRGVRRLDLIGALKSRE